MGHATMVLNQSEMFRDGNNDIGYYNKIKVLYNLFTYSCLLEFPRTSYVRFYFKNYFVKFIIAYILQEF